MKLRIATPCPKSWDELTGNNRVRNCSQCNLNVYNLALIPRGDLRRLIRKKEGRLCVRLYLRGDRKASTRDCPVGRDAILIRQIVAFAAILLVAAFGWVCRTHPGPAREQFPPWAQAVMNQVDPPKRTATTTSIDTGCFIMGRLAPANVSPTPAPETDSLNPTRD